MNKHFLEEIFRGVEGYLEIREIDKNKKSKQIFLNLDKVINYTPPKNKNVFYGVYSRKTENGKTENCHKTKVIWIDYDGIQYLSETERLAEVKQRFQSFNIPRPSVLVNSGNGVHAYWILKEPAGDEALSTVHRITELTGGDTRSTDKARVMRMPGSLNLKDKILDCEILESNYFLTYSLDDFGILVSKDTFVPEKSNDIVADRPCINAILQGVNKGDRNFCLGRLTKWLQLKSYSKNESIDIITNWNEKNNPPEDKKVLLRCFESYWHGDYKLLGCGERNRSLKPILSKYCDKSNCSFISMIERIDIVNSFQCDNEFLGDMHNISGQEIVIYGLIIRHFDGLTSSSIERKLMSKETGEPCMSEPTRIKYLKSLESRRLIEVLRGNKRDGTENIYRPIQQPMIAGYTTISNGAINGVIDKRITASELKVYVLLLKYAYNKRECFPSLETLARETGTTKKNMSHFLDKLEKADFIQKEFYDVDGLQKMRMILLV